MIARISSPFEEELAAAGCTGTAWGASLGAGAGVWLLLLVSARGSSGNMRGCGVGALCGGGCSSGRGGGAGPAGAAGGAAELVFPFFGLASAGERERTSRGAGCSGSGVGAAGIPASFRSTLVSVSGDRERTIRGTCSLLADDTAVAAAGSCRRPND